MGRNWIPKIKVKCSFCGWKGSRGKIYKNCPKCGHYHPMPTEEHQLENLRQKQEYLKRRRIKG